MHLQGIIGILLILGIGYLLCKDKKSINFKTILWAMLLQVIIAVVVLKGDSISNFMQSVIPFLSFSLFLSIIGFEILIAYFYYKYNGKLDKKIVGWFIGIQACLGILMFNIIEKFFVVCKDGVSSIIGYTTEGSKFVFGILGTNDKTLGFIFAFQVLPTIIFIASIFAILYYFGVMQFIVKAFAVIMVKFLGTSGAESTSVAASIFMGQTEAPLTIRPYLPQMTFSELMTIMTSGMAHISAGIMAAYVLVGHVEIKHLIVAVLMTAPGAILISKLMVPETDKPKTGTDLKVEVEKTDMNVIDAAARGASDGGILAVNVACMLVAIIALVALINGVIGYADKALIDVANDWKDLPVFGGFIAFVSAIFPSSLQQLLGWIFAPIAWTVGVPWHEASSVGSLMGTRMVLNEFVAFIDLGTLQKALDPRTFIIATYALCGFANFSSIAIQIRGIGALAPNKREEFAKLGLNAMIAGTLANFMTAAIVSLII